MGIVLRNAVDLVDNHHIHGIFHFRSICYSVVVTHKPHSAGDCGGISLPYPSKFNSFFISLLFLFSILLHRHVSSAWIQLLPVISLLSCIRVPSVIPLLTISVLVCYVSFACIQLYRSYRCCPVTGPISYLIPVLFPVSKACPCCLFLCLLLEGTDLLAVFYVPIEGFDGTIQITNALMDTAGLTADELTEKAKANALKDMTVRSLSAVMREMAGLPYDPDLDDVGMPLYIVSNGTNQFGTGVLAAGKAAYLRIADALGESEIFILPSSLHEVLAVPDDGQFTFQELLEMVTEINASVVAPQDILSNNVYHFSKNTLKLVHCR